jgi:hypothetical protein
MVWLGWIRLASASLLPPGHDLGFNFGARLVGSPPVLLETATKNESKTNK